MSGSSMSLMGDLLFGGRKRIPKVPLPVENPIEAWSTTPESGLRITWMGHSSLVVECDDVTILTDPVFGEYASPVSFMGRKRFHPVPAPLDKLPTIDAVLLSHDHYDHMCRPTIKKLAMMRVPFITSLGVGEVLEKFGVDSSLITELDWWESHPVAGMIVTATPAQHFSGRGIRDRNKTLWSSWVLQTAEHRVFYSADTGLTKDLEEIAKRFGPFDVSMIEIGAAHPAWEDIHLGPVHALEAFEMLGGGTFFPIHWGTFDLALHHWKEPAETLYRLALEQGVRLVTPPLGRAIEPARVGGATPWWRDVD